ncbi:MAG: hypothetical protein LBS99_00745 [Clostridiales bacterium]|jgi:hypothetical protein|nr:hypothetical protein [Clostridiales bacterium]
MILALEKTYIFLIGALLTAQMILALLAFYKLIYSGASFKRLIAWNFIVLFVPYAGPALGLIYAAKYKRQAPKQAVNPEHAPADGGEKPDDPAE